MKDVFFKTGLRHVSFREWVMPGKSRTEKIFASLTFADWCSYTLALMDNIDPTPVELVEQFKGQLDQPIDHSQWFDSWSEGPFTLNEVEQMVASGRSADKFHTSGWDTAKGVGQTYAEYLAQAQDAVNK